MLRKPEAFRNLGRPRSRWADNVEMDLKYDGKAWSGLIWRRIETSSTLL
jgi:hypothetical protein